MGLPPVPPYKEPRTSPHRTGRGRTDQLGVGDAPGDLVEGGRGDRSLLRSRYNDDERVTSPGPGTDRAAASALVLAVAGSVATLGTALLPWHQSGAVDRNGFELARAAGRLDLLETAAARAVVWAWFAVPALVAGVWLAATLRQLGWVVALAGTVGAVAILAATVVLAAPIPVEVGPVAALAAGAVTLVGAGVLAWSRRRT